MLHHGSKYESRNEWDGERVCHRFIMFVERIFEDVQAQRLVKVFEENLSQMISFADDNRILAAQIAETGKRRSEHRVTGNVAESAFFVELLQSCLYGSDVTDDTVFGQHRQYLAESIQRVFYGDGIDDQFGFEFFDFLQCGETIRVIHETQLVRVDVKHGRLVLKTQYIRKEGTHFTGSED